MARTSGVSIYCDNKAEDIPRFISLTLKVEKTALALVLHPVVSQGAMLYMTGRETVYWESDGVGDCPGLLNQKLSWEEASARLAAIGQARGEFVEPRVKGQWTVKAFRSNENLALQLQRKPNNYTMITITSNPLSRVWEWRVDRLQRYFSGASYASGGAGKLKDAIDAAVAQAIPLANEVCGVKDTLRRQPLDPQYSVLHPAKPAKVPKLEPVSNYKQPVEKAPAERKPRTPKATQAPDQAAAPKSRGRKAQTGTTEPATTTRKRGQPSAQTAAPAPAPNPAPTSTNVLPIRQTAAPAPEPRPAARVTPQLPPPPGFAPMGLKPPVEPTPAPAPAPVVLPPPPPPPVQLRPQTVQPPPGLPAALPPNYSPEALELLSEKLLAKFDTRLDALLDKAD